MIFRWRQLLAIALRLLKIPGAAEEHFRSSVSRAYYSALGEAREFCLRHGLQPRKRQPTHEEIWQYLRSGARFSNAHHQAACKAIGDLGIYLRAPRYQADYDGSTPTTEAHALKATGLASTMSKRLGGLP